MRQPANEQDERDEAPEEVSTPCKEAPRSRKRVSRAVGILCVLYALGAIAAWVAFRFWGESWWPITFLMFSPRWIWGLPLPVVLVLSALYRPRAIWVPIFTGILVLVGLMGFCIPWRSAMSPGRGPHAVRFVTANLHMNQADPKVVNDFLDETRPDVVALQGYYRSINLPYLRQPGWEIHESNGVIVASRWPVTFLGGMIAEPPETAEELASGIRNEAFAARAVVHAPLGDFQVVSLHLTSPHRAISMMRRQGHLASHLLAANSSRRESGSITVASALQQAAMPVVIAGDFNTTEESPIFRSAWAGYNDAFSVAGFGFGTTYALHRTWLRIDHILYDPGWQCHSSYTSDDIGSGHRAVFAELSR